MFKHTTALALLLATVAALPACTSNPRGGVPEALHVDAASIVGTYTGPAGRTIRVTEDGEGFDLEVTRDGLTRSYNGYVLNIDGVSVWEIALAEPADDAASDSRPFRPTYLYGRTERRGGEVHFRRLRTEWLELQARENPAFAFGRTPQIAEGSAALVVRDPAAMEAVLRLAVKDPAAFNEPEVFTKAN